MGKHLGKTLGLMASVLATMGIVASMAQAETPAPGYSQFAGCPSYKTENPKISTCLTSTISGGYLHLGNKETPITSPITLSGGINTNGGEFSFTSKGGLSKAKQKVEGGVIGLTGLTWLAELFGSSALTLYATAELAGTPKVTDIEHIELPLKVHLENTAGIIGNSCYLGSASSPVVLHLTTGTSGSLTGTQPTYTYNPSNEVLTGNGGKFVDGTFSAPGANGCTLYVFGFIPVSINSLIDSVSGLPATTGNKTVQNYSIQIVESELVYP